jgi:hypothetical protein
MEKNMSDTEYTINDMVQAAGQESPSDFQSAFASIMLDKIAASVEAKKIEIAKNYFNYEDAEETSAEQEEEPHEDTEEAAGV